MTPERLAEIMARAEKATPDVILNRYDHGGGRAFAQLVDEKRRPWQRLVFDAFEEADREFYFNARTDVPMLCNTLLSERREREALESALKECRACIEDGKPSHALDVIDRVLGPKEQSNG